MKVSIHKVEKVNVKGKGEIIKLCGRDANKNPVILSSYGHQPYFYVSENTLVPKSEYIVNTINHKFNSVFHKPVKQIITINSDNVPKVRELFSAKECFEDDVLYILRWAIDIGLKNGIECPDDISKPIHYKQLKPIDFFVEFRRLHIDLEVMIGEGHKVPDYRNPVSRITAISCIDSYIKLVTTFTNNPKYGENLLKKLRVTKTKILYTEETRTEKVEICELLTEIGTKYKWRKIFYKTEIMVEFSDPTMKTFKSKNEVEYTMLKRFIDYFAKIRPDFFCGWNITGFDLPYLVFRMKKLGVDYKKLSPFGIVLLNEDNSFLDAVRIKGLVVFDTMLYYKKMHTHKISLKLEDAASDKLGYGKVKYTGTLDSLYYENEAKFLEYNAIDVVAEYEIFEKMGMLNFYSGLRRYIGVPYEQMQYNKQIIDFYVLAKAKQFGFVLPSARENKQKAKAMTKKEQTRYSGAYVPIPLIIGRIMYVLTVDLKSLYPLIMLTWNLGADTLFGETSNKSITDIVKKKCIITPPIGKNNIILSFLKDKLSFISVCIKELIDYRDDLRQKLYEMKKQKEKYSEFEIQILDDIQKVVKFITNTIYGVFGYPNFRLFDVRIAEAITTIGRMVLIDTIKFIEKHDIKTIKLTVIGGDTDSAFTQLLKQLKTLLKLDKNAISHFMNLFEKNCPKEDQETFEYEEKIMIGIAYSLTNQLNKYYKKYTSEFNLAENYLQIKPEDIAAIFFTIRKKRSEQAAKKKYIKNIIVEFEQDKPIKVNRIESKGLVKSNLSVVETAIVRQIEKLICQDKTNEEINVDVEEYLRTEILKIKNNKYEFVDICKRVGMSKYITEYLNEEHVRAARWTREHAKLWNGISNYDRGSTVKYLFVKPEKVTWLSSYFDKFTRTNVVALDDNNYLPDEFKEVIDYDYLITKTVIEPLLEILQSLNVDFEYIKKGKRQKKMF